MDLEALLPLSSNDSVCRYQNSLVESLKNCQMFLEVNFKNQNTKVSSWIYSIFSLAFKTNLYHQLTISLLD